MAVVNLMSENEDEEDWKYASAGFGQTNYSLWDEDEPTALDYENDEQEQLDAPL